MATLIQRPTTIKHDKDGWLLQGPWGKRRLPSMSKVDLYAQLHRELIESGVLAADSPAPSNQHHSHVTLAMAGCSWANGSWVRDDALVAAG